MQKITLITVGRLKEEYLKQAEQEYQKRLGVFCDLQMIEIPQAPLPQNPSEGQIRQALENEAEQILNKIPKNAEVISLCVEGKLYSSEQLSEVLAANAIERSGSIAFIIGGSFGLGERVKQNSRIRLSMSKMTFPHRLAKILLLEQIYRGYQIEKGGRYHK